MRAPVLFAILTLCLSLSARADEWQITSSTDPITDEFSLSATIYGTNKTAFYFGCREHNKTMYFAAGMHVPGASLRGDTKAVRLRFNKAEVKQDELMIHEDRLLKGADDAFDFIKSVREAETFAYDFVDDDGRRFVDSFKPQSSNDNQIELLEGLVACRKRMHRRD